MRRAGATLAAAAWLLLALPAPANKPTVQPTVQPATEPPADLAQRVVAAYQWLQTYCDRISGLPRIALQDRCLHADGRFRTSSTVAGAGDVVEHRWGTAGRQHRYEVSLAAGRERPLRYDARAADGFGETPAEDFAARILQPLALGRDAAQIRRELGSFEPRQSDDDDHWLLVQGQRQLTVRRADGVILRDAIVGANRVIHRQVDFADIRLDPALDAAALAREVPVTTRYSIARTPALVLTALAVLGAGGGTPLWAAYFLLAAQSHGALPPFRGRRRWRRFGGLLLLALLILGALALSALGSNSGHPPAIVVVYALAVMAAMGFAVLLGLVAAAHPGYRIARVLLQRRDGPAAAR